MKKISIIINRKKESAVRLLPKVREWLESKQCQVSDNVDRPDAEIISGADLIISLGGDGTLLRAVNLTGDHSMPVLGVNLGQVGFLTEVKEDEVFDELAVFLEGKSEIEERFMLSCHVESKAKQFKKTLPALNDIVISREGLTRLLRIEINISGEKLTGFAGDGVILASATGSTAYSFSAGGSVVHPKLAALIITPICPHVSALRPIVVSCDETIDVHTETQGGEARAVLSADGQENIVIDDSFNVRIVRSEKPLKLIKSSKRTYLETLREKFKFPV